MRVFGYVYFKEMFNYSEQQNMHTNPSIVPHGLSEKEKGTAKGKMKDNRLMKKEKKQQIKGDTKATTKGIYAQVSEKCRLRGHSERGGGEGGQGNTR